MAAAGGAQPAGMAGRGSRARGRRDANLRKTRGERVRPLGAVTGAGERGPAAAGAHGLQGAPHVHLSGWHLFPAAAKAETERKRLLGFARILRPRGTGSAPQALRAPGVGRPASLGPGPRVLPRRATPSSLPAHPPPDPHQRTHPGPSPSSHSPPGPGAQETALSRQRRRIRRPHDGQAGAPAVPANGEGLGLRTRRASKGSPQPPAHLWVPRPQPSRLQPP